MPVVAKKFGVTLFQLATGELPFADGDVSYRHRHEAPPDPRELEADVPAALAQLILALMATQTFVRAVNPAYVLSSNDRSLTGKQRRFEELIGNAVLYRTNRSGAITVRIAEDGTMRVETFIRQTE